MKSDFEIKDTFLKNANHYIELEKGLYCASFIGQIIIGPVEYDNQRQLKFSNTSVIVPAKEFFEFVNLLHRGRKAYLENSSEPFEEILYNHSPTYHLMALFNEYEKMWHFSLRYFWYFNRDRKYLQRVSVGLAEPIKTTNGQEFIPLPRGVKLDKDQVDLLWNQIHVLLQHTIFANDHVKQKVREFVSYVVGKSDLCNAIKAKLENFKTMKFPEKADFLEELFNSMLLEKNVPSTSYEAQMHLETLTNKMNLVYSLFNFYLKSSDEA